VVQVSINL